jgi:dipeptidase D
MFEISVSLARSRRCERGFRGRGAWGGGYFLALALVLLLLPCTLLAENPREASLPSYLDAGARAVSRLENSDGPTAFATFRKAVAAAAEADGKTDIAAGVRALEPGTVAPSERLALASRLLRRYVVSYYGQRMIADLQEMVRFRTQEQPGSENWQAPEFQRQRQWLERRAQELGLVFKSYDGRVEEITLAGPSPILAVLTHGDVQGVEEQIWSSPPFEGRLVNGRIIGRGTEDDKGPIVATLYGLAALRDAGWLLNSTVRLLVTNAEESSWEDVPYYLQRAPMPQRTIGIDASYPVTFAQKGYGVVTIRAQAGAANPSDAAWQVVAMSGGSGLSIIPEHGEALLQPRGNIEPMLTALTEMARRWSAEHPPARLIVSRAGELLKVRAEGKGGHSSEPQSGHNALGDLTAFLATLDLKMDAWGALASLVGTTVGAEVDGASLGIAHTDQLMGSLTVNLAFLVKEGEDPVARINTRVPRGLSNEEMTARIREKAEAFNRRTGARITTESQLLSQPHVADERFVSTLLSVWQDVTGTPGRALAIGGGTQARLFPGGVDFGPSLSMEHYRGHGPDEYLTTDELLRIAELTIAAVWKLTGGQ